MSTMLRRTPYAQRRLNEGANAIGFGLGCGVARKDDLGVSLQIGLRIVCGSFAIFNNCFRFYWLSIKGRD